MNFLCSCLAEEFYDYGTCCTSYYGVIYKNYSLILYGVGNYIELYLNFIFADILTGNDKCSAYLFILNKSYAVRYARLSGITHCSIKTRIGNADYYICLYRMFLSKVFTCI